MIEIVFNHLKSNSLKAAQQYGEGKYPGGYSFITYYNEDGSLMTEAEAKEAEKEAELAEARKWAEATPLGGSRDDVFDLSMNLNIGDISCWDNLDKRIDSFGEFLHDQEGYSITEYEERTQGYVLEDLRTIIERLKKGESARIWYVDTAGETLSFQWLMWSLNNAKVPINKVLINHKETWSKMTPGDWHKFVDDAKPLTSQTMDKAAAEWENHMKENAMLRVMEDGMIKAAPVSYYDELIMQEAALETKEENKGFQENWLMGALCEKEPEIPSYWFYTRIEQMIKEGRFTVKKEASEGWPKSWKIIDIA